MSLPRFLHRLDARLFGYYWRPCPLCGRWHGGHETADDGSVDIPGAPGQLVCPACVPTARARNKRFFPFAEGEVNYL